MPYKSPTKLKAYLAAWRARNRARCAEYLREWRAMSPDHVAAQNARRSKCGLVLDRAAK